MSKALRDYNGKAFLRKLGEDNFSEYLQATQHPMLSAINTYLQQDKGLFYQHCTDIDELLSSTENPRREEDITDLSLINDLASERGFLVMKSVCEEHSLDNLITEKITPHDLAQKLFGSHRPLFDEAHDLLEVDYQEGWVQYLAQDISKLVDDLSSAKDTFQKSVAKEIRSHKQGYQIHVDRYSSRGRVILNIYNDGIQIREQSFDSTGKIHPVTRSKVAESSVIYNEYTGLLKIKTPRGKDELNSFIHETFANCFLKNPEALLTVKTNRVVILDDLLTRNSFQVDSGLECAKLTSLTILPFPGKSFKMTLYAKDGEIPELLNQLQLKHRGIKVIQAGIQFVFKGKGRGKTRTATLWTRNNKDNLNNTQRDDIIRDHLKKWGLLNA